MPSMMGPFTFRALGDVMDERRRQIEVEGFGPDHDDKHSDESLAEAAASYILANEAWSWAEGVLFLWPWAPEWFKPKDRRRNLVRAAALLIAEIERIDRAQAGMK